MPAVPALGELQRWQRTLSPVPRRALSNRCTSPASNSPITGRSQSPAASVRGGLRRSPRPGGVDGVKSGRVRRASPSPGGAFDASSGWTLPRAAKGQSQQQWSPQQPPQQQRRRRTGQRSRTPTAGSSVQPPWRPTCTASPWLAVPPPAAGTARCRRAAAASPVRTRRASPSATSARNAPTGGWATLAAKRVAGGLSARFRPAGDRTLSPCPACVAAVAGPYGARPGSPSVTRARSSAGPAVRSRAASVPMPPPSARGLSPGPPKSPPRPGPLPAAAVAGTAVSLSQLHREPPETPEVPELEPLAPPERPAEIKCVLAGAVYAEEVSGTEHAEERNGTSVISGGSLVQGQSMSFSSLQPGALVELSPRGANVPSYNWDLDPLRPGEVGQVVADPQSGRFKEVCGVDGKQVLVAGPRGDADWYSLSDVQKAQPHHESPKTTSTRLARAGDRVVNVYGVPSDDGPGHAWRLGAHEVAVVVSVDEDGDLCLRNQAGMDSRYWKFATHFRTVGGTRFIRRQGVHQPAAPASPLSGMATPSFRTQPQSVKHPRQPLSFGNPPPSETATSQS